MVHYGPRRLGGVQEVTGTQPRGQHGHLKCRLPSDLLLLAGDLARTGAQIGVVQEVQAVQAVQVVRVVQVVMDLVDSVLGELKLAVLLALVLLLGMSPPPSLAATVANMIHRTTWTAGWGPFSSWTGLWSGCSSTTATPQPATITTTVSGHVITGTTFGIQALSSGSGSSSGSASGSAAAGSTASLIDTTKVLTISGLVAGSVFALMVTL